MRFPARNRVFGRVGLLLVGLGLTPAALADHQRADVVVHGGTASGVIAAVAAAREGKSVVLLESGRHVGGMVSGGLGATDTGNRRAIGGHAREFFDRVKAHYTARYGPNSAQVKDCSDGFHFEPGVAEAILRDMLKEAGVTLLEGKRLGSVQKEGARIVSITTDDRDVFTAAVFIDASYEGDLMALAGVAYRVGREGRDEHGESLAGVQQRSPSHQWPVPVSPMDGKGGLIPGVMPGPAEPAGTGDRKVQAYNYRLCMTDVEANRVPFPKPTHYDPARYELLARFLERKPGLTVRQLMNPVRMPNGKTDTNNNGPFSTDHIGGNWDYPDGDAATRARIVQDHVDYVQGFYYFLANDPRVPRDLHNEINRWGLARDEFVDTGHWPHQLYVREARRMVGAYLMTQADIMKQRTKDDSVGLGSYNTDSHHVQRLSTPDGAVINEGDFQVGVQPYAIPYRSLVPRPSECINLLVPVCLSATHVAYGTIRMEPVYMILGQACGVAAALANGGPVQDVDSGALREKLLAQKAVLNPSDVPVPPRSSRPESLDPKTLGGVVVDDEQAEVVGDWLQSASVGPFVGDGYRHDANDGKGDKRVRFTPNLPRAGKYEVRLYSTPNPNRATNVPVVIHHDPAETTVKIDQRRAIDSTRSILLGTFSFPAGKSSWVEIRTIGTNGHVIADAVRFVAVE